MQIKRFFLQRNINFIIFKSDEAYPMASHIHFLNSGILETLEKIMRGVIFFQEHYLLSSGRYRRNVNFINQISQLHLSLKYQFISTNMKISIPKFLGISHINTIYFYFSIKTGKI